MSEKDILDELNEKSGAQKEGGPTEQESKPDGEKQAGTVDDTAAKSSKKGFKVAILAILVLGALGVSGGYYYTNSQSKLTYSSGGAQTPTAAQNPVPAAAQNPVPTAAPDPIPEAKPAWVAEVEALQKSVEANRVQGDQNSKQLDQINKLVAKIQEDSKDIQLLVDSAFSRTAETERKVEQLRVNVSNALNGFSSKLQEYDVLLAKMKAEKVKAIAGRNRLPEFAVLQEVADGVFSVQAPDRKDGSPHYITLYEGEGFVSKQGRHVVTGFETDAEGNVVLEIDGKWFIDGEREQYSSAQLARMTNKSQRVKAKPKKPQAIQTAQTTQEHVGLTASPQPQVLPAPAKEPEMQAVRATKVSSQDVVQYRDGKVLLRDWRVIATMPKENRAVIVNSTDPSASVQEVKMNGYYGFLGTVRSIDSVNGVCSDSHCIVE